MRGQRWDVERQVVRTYRWWIAAFVLLELAVALLPSSPATAQWSVVVGYGIVALFAAALQAPVATLAAVSVALVRTAVALGATGALLRFPTMVFSDVFFLLVLLEASYRRTFRR